MLSDFARARLESLRGGGLSARESIERVRLEVDDDDQDELDLVEMELDELEDDDDDELELSMQDWPDDDDDELEDEAW